MSFPEKNYRPWLAELKQGIQQQKIRASLQVNAGMLALYWHLGWQINEKIDKQGWGAKVIDRLSIDLQKSFPDLQGFSVRNLKYMRKFVQVYSDFPIVQQPAAQLENSRKSGSKKAIVQQPAAQLSSMEQLFSNPVLTGIPWGHHMLLIDKVNDADERLWYIQKTIENNWSRAVLQYQIDTDLYQRQHKAKKQTNFHLTLPKPQSDLANQILKDPYKFDFLQLGDEFTELELEKELIKHVQDFLIELGAGFAFVGRQQKFKVGKKEYFVDLLFYHLHLRSYIAIDLKVNEFELEHTGKMNGYLNMINAQLKHKQDNPSIGIILCGSKDEVEVDFALSSINHPIGVSEYKFIKSLPKKFQGKIPGAKELQNEVQMFLKDKAAHKK